MSSRYEVAAGAGAARASPRNAANANANAPTDMPPAIAANIVPKPRARRSDRRQAGRQARRARSRSAPPSAPSLRRIAALWLDRGYDEAVRTLAGESPDWLGVYFEVARKFRHDPALRRRWSERAPALEARLVERIAALQADGTYRSDVTVEQIGRFLGVVIDGVVSQASFGERIDVEGVLKLVRSALVPGDLPK